MSLGSVFLPAFRKNALAANARLLPRILQGEAGAAEVLEFCGNYRVTAICSLLMRWATHGTRAPSYQRLAAKEAIPLWESSTEGHLSIEGLALVALAERKGLATRSDYLHVPSLARLPALASGAASDWRQPTD